MIQCFCSGQEADCLEAAVVQRRGFSLISAEKERKSDWLQFWKNFLQVDVRGTADFTAKPISPDSSGAGGDESGRDCDGDED